MCASNWNDAFGQPIPTEESPKSSSKAEPVIKISTTKARGAELAGQRVTASPRNPDSNNNNKAKRGAPKPKNRKMQMKRRELKAKKSRKMSSELDVKRL